MEPISAAAVGYLVAAIKENKDLKKFGNDFFDAFIHWIKPVFLKDDETEKEALQNLKNNPDDKFNQEAAVNEIERHLAQRPTDVITLENWLQQLKSIHLSPAATYITHQVHSGAGDNVVNKVG